MIYTRHEIRDLVLKGQPWPEGLQVDWLCLRGCTGLKSLPEGLEVDWLDLTGCTGLTGLPEGLQVEGLNLQDCTGLTSLPKGLEVDILDLTGCTGLTSLPEGLQVDWLDLTDCTGLTSLPKGLRKCLSVPIVQDLDRRVAEAVGQDGENLEMGDWHQCDTAHCRAGWAIHIAGEAGYRLEEIAGPAGAGALIYLASAGHIPDFYASNDDALTDIKARA